jgi:glutamate-1-semialdehyde 2,1-aminomutase
MSPRDPHSPGAILVQASSRSWAGGEDYCLREFDGLPAVAHTIAAARQRFPETPIRIIAPEFDRGGRLDGVARAATGDVQALYGYDHSPLDRMLMATSELSEDDLVLRADGLHFAADFDLAVTMLRRARERGLDGIKTPDDFPPPLSVDVLRVGALRRARAMLNDEEGPFLVHPKFLLSSHPEFRFEWQEDLPEYSEHHLSMVRRKTTIMIGGVDRLDVGGRGRIATGDQLSYHYELALRHLAADDRVLDVACGDGFGARVIAGVCAQVVGVDIDELSIAAARARAGDRDSYVVADATRMPFDGGAFDAVVSFETIEHVPARSFLEEVHRVLAPGGLLLLSTPQSRLGRIPFTPAHEHEFSLEELTDIVGERFEILQRIGLKAGTIWFEGDPVGTNSFFVCRSASGVQPASTTSRSIAASQALWERALRVIPGGTQTLSKAPSQFVDGVSPKFLRRGSGAHVWDVDGNEYIDYPMALGPILLGYDHPAVTEAVVAQIHDGTTFTLMHPLEVEVAELLVELIPCAERVRFAKNGADATGGAIRAARALSGREHVIATGYHGYHDWYIASTERNAGVPAANGDLIHTVAFGDLVALEHALGEWETAAVIMEIPGHDPAPGYLHAALELAHHHGALLILDEIVTGFRYALGGAQELYGFTPDLACLGKGMANGYPLAAVVGREQPMRAFEEIFFSMTYSGETVSLAAARATLGVLRKEPVVAHIWARGRELRGGLERLAAKVSFSVELAGNPPRSALTFGKPQSVGGEGVDLSTSLRGLFLQECHRRGVLFGGPMFPTYSHTPQDIAFTLDAAEAAFALMEMAYSAGDIETHMEGRTPGVVFRSHD